MNQYDPINRGKGKFLNEFDGTLTRDDFPEKFPDDIVLYHYQLNRRVISDRQGAHVVPSGRFAISEICRNWEELEKEMQLIMDEENDTGKLRTT